MTAHARPRSESLADEVLALRLERDRLKALLCQATEKLRTFQRESADLTALLTALDHD